MKMIAAFPFASKEAVFNCFRYSRVTRNEDVRLVSMVVLQRSSDISHRLSSLTTDMAWLTIIICTDPKVCWADEKSWTTSSSTRRSAFTACKFSGFFPRSGSRDLELELKWAVTMAPCSNFRIFWLILVALLSDCYRDNRPRKRRTVSRPIPPLAPGR